METYKIDGKKTNKAKWIKAQDGLCQTFYNNGQLWHSCLYINGKKNGLCQDFYNNGKLGFSCPYINGKEHGLYQCFRENGKLEYSSLYVNGVEREDLIGEDMALARLVILGHDPMENK